MIRPPNTFSPCLPCARAQVDAYAAAALAAGYKAFVVTPPRDSKPQELSLGPKKYLILQSYFIMNFIENMGPESRAQVITVDVQLGSRRERDIANRRSTGPASLGGMSTGFDKQAGFTWADVARFKAAWPGYPLLVKVRGPGRALVAPGVPRI